MLSHRSSTNRIFSDVLSWAISGILVSRIVSLLLRHRPVWILFSDVDEACSVFFINDSEGKVKIQKDGSHLLLGLTVVILSPINRSFCRLTQFSLNCSSLWVESGFQIG